MPRSRKDAAIIDAAIGLGMAFVGIVYERIVLNSARVQRVAIIGLLATD
jgi:hypothetical protein